MGNLLKCFLLSVAVLIVGIPEGFSLAISIGLALCTDHLKEDNLLIKNHSAMEKTGLLEYIITGKTGTLTEGKMKANRLIVADGDEEHLHDLMSIL